MRTIKSLSGSLTFISRFHPTQFSLSLSADTISLQKKVPLGTDRLKRLDSSTSLFQRQTSLLTKKVTNFATKLVNPFANIKKKVDPPTPELSSVDSQVDLRVNMKRQCFLADEPMRPPRRTVTISSLKRARDDDDDDEPGPERRKVQVLSVNNEIRRPAGLFSYNEAAKPSGKILRNVRIDPTGTLFSLRSCSCSSTEQQAIQARRDDLVPHTFTR